MKILNCFLDNRFGGPQRRASNVARELKKYNIETFFLFNEKLKDNIPIKGFTCFLIKHIQCIIRGATTINMCMFLLFFPYSLYKICRLIKSEKIDLVHTNGLINCIPIIAARLMRVKTIWHLNDTVTPWVLRTIFLPLVSSLSDKIIIASRKVGEFYFNSNDRLWSKSTIVYAPVDIIRFNPESIEAKSIDSLKKELNIAPHDFVAGTVGNINRAKGYEYLIEAAQIIKSRGEGVKIVIVGKELENNKFYYQKICDLIRAYNLINDIILAGFRENIIDIVYIFDVFVLSSIHEACPIAVLEAMAMKVPVVATNVGGVCEQIIDGESGIVIPPRRPDLLADGIIEIMNSSNEVLKKMTDVGHKRAEEIFSLNIITTKHKQIYEQILLN